ncbi:MAG: phospholipase D family protein [Psychrobium sp.]
MDLYTNTSSKGDFVKNGINSSALEFTDIYIATAFFTEYELIEELTAKGCSVKLIVRLGFPTCPKALKKVMLKDDVDIRFFTSNSFHPKLYIFGNNNALVGSANLTRAAIQSNQEVVVNIGSNDSRFNELQMLFDDYWQEATVLCYESLKKYNSIYEKANQAHKLIISFDNDVIDLLGDKNYTNIERGKVKSTKQSIFYDGYSKSYQEATSAFTKILDVYNEKPRKTLNETIPLRLEVDSFFSFVRDRHAKVDKWKRTTIGWDNQKREHVAALIDEWLNTPWDHFDNTIVHKNYPKITSVFSSATQIINSTYDEIIEALCVLHAFYEQLRFHKGGLDSLKLNFKAANDVEKVKRTLVYLIFGRGNVIERMADCIYSKEYQLSYFGESTVQELIGWINNENLPVINGRTTKILRYFGFKVKQL